MYKSIEYCLFVIVLSIGFSVSCSGERNPTPAPVTRAQVEVEDDGKAKPEPMPKIPIDMPPAPPMNDDSKEEDKPPPPQEPGQTRRSLGCDLSTYETSTAERFMSLNGENRRYQVKLPEDYDSSRAYPLVFALHGLNENGNNTRNRFDGVITDDGIQVFPDGEGEQWNNNTDMDFIDELLTQLQSEYCVDTGRVFAVGFSAGGGGTHAIGCFLGDRFRAIAPIAGTGTFTECEGRVAVMQIQGTSDIVARAEAAAAVREHWVAVNQCNGSEDRVESDYERCDAFEGCMEDYPTLYCEHRGGHDWPRWANPMIWDFFLSLDPIAPGDDPEEGNDGMQASSVTFTLDIPSNFVGVPLKVAPILYGPNTFQPIFVAPSLILNNGVAIGNEFVFGQQVQYEISPINLAGLSLPADFTFTVVVYVEGGGDPTPCEKDWIGLGPVTIEDTGNLVIEDPLSLVPFQAIPFFFNCP